jgi:glycosyltransferase involved in cell wall biosynthesis
MRVTASIVVHARGDWQLTRVCLEALRPTLGVRDQVVVVVDGSTQRMPGQLPSRSRLTVVTHEQPLPTHAAANSGAAHATGEVVVFLGNDTLVPSRWLDALLAPFDDDAVGATGPRTNHVLGPQLVERVHYDVERLADLNRFGRGWREEHRGRTTDVTRLAGFCLAVRRSLFQQLGGFEAAALAGDHHADRLCAGISAAGSRMLIAHEAFVHHHGLHDRTAALPVEHGEGGPSPQPLVSASLIVKDEQDVLEQCLGSLAGLADEVVVYDTGSNDDTVAIARRMGAVVVEGYWDDDFGRARNASLAACTGQWVLVLDADEMVTGDREALRARAAATDAEALNLQIDNLDDLGGVTFSHTGTRLFRRSRAQWHGRLHEQVVSRSSQPLVHEVFQDASILHVGYTTEMMEGRQKTERNERVARAAAEATGGADALVLVNLGRALNAAGKDEEALTSFRRVRELTSNTSLLRQALRAGASILMGSGRAQEALEWVEELRRHSGTSGMADYLEGLARLNLQDSEGALACFQRIEEASDEDYAVSSHIVQLRRGLALMALEDWDAAAAELLEGVRGRRLTDPVWAPLVEAHWRSGRPLERVLDVVPDDHLMTVLGQLLHAEPLAADALVELLWERRPGDRRVLAFALQGSVRLPLPRVLEWAARLRAAGLERDCPLLQVAADESAAPLDRVRAAAIAAEGFGDARGEALVSPAAAALQPEDFLVALLALDELAPTLLPALLLGVATTPERAEQMADALRSVGAVEQADALLELVPA